MKENQRIYYECGDLLYEFLAETRFTVYRRLDNTETIAKLARLGPAGKNTTLGNLIELTMID